MTSLKLARKWFVLYSVLFLFAHQASGAAAGSCADYFSRSTVTSSSLPASGRLSPAKIRALEQTPKYRNQHVAFLNWAAQKNKEIAGTVESGQKDDRHFNEPLPLKITPAQIKKPSQSVARRIEQTSQLYFKLFGRDSIGSFVWSGVEPGNPLTRHEDYRWNSLKETGLYEHGNRLKLASQLKSIGIRNIRVGLSNHEIALEKPETWRETTALINDFHKSGMKMSLDLHHFGIEDRFRVVGKDGKTVGAESYYLNKSWPDYFAKFAAETVRRFHKQIQAITIMNEPETVVGFNGEMWHGGYPGWAAPESNRIYIDRAINVALASVKARIAIEQTMRSLPKKDQKEFLYMHTEASVHKGYWEDFNLYRRFIISDMILGSDWVLHADLNWLATAPLSEFEGRWGRLRKEDRTVFDWVIENALVYNVAPHEREVFRQKLVANLRELRGVHQALNYKFNVTMKTNTVFATDYYAHNEDKGSDNEWLDPEPQHYVEQVASGRRGGLYRVVTDYYSRYEMPMMMGEIGTPWYHYASRWNQQSALELSEVANVGIPFLGYTLYPAVDTYGMESAMSVPRSQALYNPSGVAQLAPDEKDPVAKKKVEYTVRHSMRRFSEALQKNIPFE